MTLLFTPYGHGLLLYLVIFIQAKDNARMQNKWLIVNMQSTKEFSSHTVRVLSSLHIMCLNICAFVRAYACENTKMKYCILDEKVEVLILLNLK